VAGGQQRQQAAVAVALVVADVSYQGPDADAFLR